MKPLAAPEGVEGAHASRKPVRERDAVSGGKNGGAGGLRRVAGAALAVFGAALVCLSVLPFFGPSAVADVSGGGLADTLRAGPGGELVRSFGGDDALYGGAGGDVMLGGAGDDFVEVAGGARDHVSCGPGRDLVNADGSDVVADNCETVYFP